MSVNYASEKFNQARRILMLPHLEGEAMSIMHAFAECQHGLSDLQPEEREQLDDYARNAVAKLESLMDTTGIEDPGKRGTWVIKAEGFSADEKIEVSNCVDTLAYVFDELAAGTR